MRAMRRHRGLMLMLDMWNATALVLPAQELVYGTHISRPLEKHSHLKLGRRPICKAKVALHEQHTVRTLCWCPFSPGRMEFRVSKVVDLYGERERKGYLRKDGGHEKGGAPVSIVGLFLGWAPGGWLAVPSGNLFSPSHIQINSIEENSNCAPPTRLVHECGWLLAQVVHSVRTNF